MTTALAALQQRIVACRLCPRLVAHREQVAVDKRHAYRDWTYWGRPVPSFGDPNARLLILGLAPAAHGANRTGRVFTGDRSGDFLFRALHETGFASQPHSRHRDDGLSLTDAYIASPVRCAPPDNRPSPDELATCRAYLREEVPLLPHLQVVVALGRIAHDAYLTLLQEQGLIRSRAAHPFGHGLAHPIPGCPTLLGCYHPSQQNTSTGRLTLPMLIALFSQARSLLSHPVAPVPGG